MASAAGSLRVVSCKLPDRSLLSAYQARGCHTDCYSLDIEPGASFEEYLFAFYASRMFRPERFLLGLLGMKSTMHDIRRLAEGNTQNFAAWTVEARTGDQLVLCDYRKVTRSWLMTEATDRGSRLYFGSAVVHSGQGGAKLVLSKMVFASLLWFHKLYSRALLRSAAARLRTKR